MKDPRAFPLFVCAPLAVAVFCSAGAQAQTTTSTTDRGTSMAITGDQGRFIAANGAGNAANAVTSWYLKHAESLLPTINIGSGEDVWMIVQESVELPNWYFTQQAEAKGGFSYLTQFNQ